MLAAGMWLSLYMDIARSLFRNHEITSAFIISATLAAVSASRGANNGEVQILLSVESVPPFYLSSDHTNFSKSNSSMHQIHG